MFWCAHWIKNIESAAHTTIEWLAAEFLVLATASVLPNRIEDCTRGIVGRKMLNLLGVVVRAIMISPNIDIRPSL